MCDCNCIWTGWVVVFLCVRPALPAGTSSFYQLLSTFHLTGFKDTALHSPCFLSSFQKEKNRQLNICLGSPCKHICCVEKTSTCIRQSNTCVWYSRAQTPTDGVSSQSDQIMLLKAKFNILSLPVDKLATCVGDNFGQLCFEFH